MMKFGIDIDDTIADGVGYFVPALNKHLGQNLKVKDVKGRLNTSYNVEQSIIDDFFLRLGDKVFSELKPVPGALETINHLYDEGFEVYFITARPKEANEVTKQWLKKYGFKYNGLFHSETKIEIAQELGIKLFVDDSPTIVESMHKHGIKSIFMDIPKNNHIATSKGIIRAKNWKEVTEHIHQDLLLYK